MLNKLARKIAFKIFFNFLDILFVFAKIFIKINSFLFLLNFEKNIILIIFIPHLLTQYQ